MEDTNSFQLVDTFETRKFYFSKSIEAYQEALITVSNIYSDVESYAKEHLIHLNEEVSLEKYRGSRDLKLEIPIND